MKDYEMYKQLDEIYKRLGKLLNKNNNKSEIQLSPLQQAVKTVTAKDSTDDQVKQSLQVFVDTPQALTPSQVGFCLYFLYLNHVTLGEDIKYWLTLEIGKHKYDQRDKFIDSVCNVLAEKYKSNMTIVNGLKTFLADFKVK